MSEEDVRSQRKRDTWGETQNKNSKNITKVDRKTERKSISLGEGVKLMNTYVVDNSKFKCIYAGSEKEAAFNDEFEYGTRVRVLVRRPSHKNVWERTKRSLWSKVWCCNWIAKGSRSFGKDLFQEERVVRHY